MPTTITPVVAGRCRPSPDRVPEGAPSDRHGGCVVASGLLATAGNPFGDGQAAGRVLAQLAEDFAAEVPVGLTASGPYSAA